MFAELPTLLPIVELAEVLLHVQNGAWLLCRVVANKPDSFYEGIFVGWLRRVFILSPPDSVG